MSQNQAVYALVHQRVREECEMGTYFEEVCMSKVQRHVHGKRVRVEED